MAAQSNSRRSKRSPATLAEAVEREAELPPGLEERFSGYGVMGMPLRSGHVLCLRGFPASSIGPGYRSVWHRDTDGRWTFYQDQPAELACTRAWHARPVLAVMSRGAGSALQAGRVRLTGVAPNGQRFLANPLTIWVRAPSLPIWPAIQRRQGRPMATPLTERTHPYDRH